MTTRTVDPAKTRKPSQKSLAEEAFAKEWKRGPCGHSRMVTVNEHKFHPTRQWRFDFAIPIARIAVEIEGLGRHQTVTGFRDDAEKYNAAARYGWTVFRLPTTDIKRRNEWGESSIELFVESVCEHLVFGVIPATVTEHLLTSLDNSSSQRAPQRHAQAGLARRRTTPRSLPASSSHLLVSKAQRVTATGLRLRSR